MIEEIHNTSTPDPKLTVIDKLRMLLDITKTISQTLDLNEVLAKVMDTLGSLLPYDAAAIYLIEKDAEGNAVYLTQMLRGYELEELVNPSLKRGEGFIGRVAQLGQPILSGDATQDFRYIAARRRTNSEMTAPIIANDEVIGVFDLESDKFDAYSKDDLEILLLLASQVATIVEKVELHEQVVEKKRIETQLEVARQVQLELLPDSDPQVSGFDVSGYNFPTWEVSGDYYDWVKTYDDQINVVIADASGKGIPAALLVAFLRATLRAAIHVGYATHISLTKANFLLWESIENNQFVTAILGTLDATNKTFAYANAGHNPPLLLHKNGDAEFIERGGLPLGMFRDTRYYEHFLQLECGQILLLYTDGITEAANHESEEFGQDRLAECVRRGKDLTARELIDLIYQEVATFTGEIGFDDDCTLLVVKC